MIFVFLSLCLPSRYGFTITTLTVLTLAAGLAHCVVGIQICFVEIVCFDVFYAAMYAWVHAERVLGL